jgi:hypothetical protein
MDLGYLLGAVDSATRSFGKIIDGQGKRFTVLWSDGRVTETGIPDAKKVVLNSPSFFNEIQPERNQELFEANPFQLVAELLWETKCLAAESAKHSTSKKKGRPGALSSSEIKSFVLASGVAASTWEKSWAKIRKSIGTSETQLAVDGQDYWLSESDFSVSNPIDIDWDSLMGASSSAKDSALDLLVNQVDENEQVPPNSSPKTDLDSLDKNGEALPQNAWLKFKVAIERKVEFSLSLSATEALQELELIADNARTLDSASLSALQNLISKTKSADVYLIGSVIARSALEPAKKQAQQASLRIAQILEALSSFAEDLSVTQRVTLSSLLLSDQSAVFIKRVTDDALAKVAWLVLSLTSPELLSIKDLVVAEILARSRAGLDFSDEMMLSLLANLSWRDTKRRSLTEHLIRRDSKILRSSDFWRGVSLEELPWLAQLEHWQRLINKDSVSQPLSAAISAHLETLNQKDAIQALLLVDFFGQIVDQPAIDSLVKRALESNPQTRISLQSFSSQAQIDALEVRIAEAARSTSDLQRRLVEAEAARSSYERQIELLTQKVDVAANQVTKLRENEKAQYQLDAAKALARILSTLDNELGENFTGRELVLDQAKKIGIIELFEFGAIEIHSQETCDDPSSSANPGDEIRVVAPGYAWSDGNQRVVLVRALVTSI